MSASVIAGDTPPTSPSPRRRPCAAAFRAARQQNHQHIAIPPKIDAIQRAEIDPAFQHPYPFEVEGVALFQPPKRDRHARGCCRIEIRKPPLERAFVVGRDETATLDHP